jgi:hypothetical protein
MTRCRHAVSLVSACALATALVLWLTAEPAAADHCGFFADCFATAEAVLKALQALMFAAMLLLMFHPLGRAFLTIYGLFGAVTGRDPITGEKLSMAERALGAIVPGAGKNIARGLRAAAQADDAARGARVARYTDDAVPPAAPAGRPVRTRAFEDAVPPEVLRNPSHRRGLTTQGDATHAVATVDGRLAPGAKVRRSGGDIHAEQRVVDGGDLRSAVDEAVRTGTRERPATVRVVLSRTPCHTRCTPLLDGALRAELARLTPEELARVRFELVARGPYEPSKLDPSSTMTKGLLGLIDAGWDVRAMSVDGNLTTWGAELGEAAARLHALRNPPGGV